MAEPEGKKYRLTSVPPAVEQIRALDAKAEQHGISEWYRNTLKAVIELLRTQPTVWGDPVRNTVLPGGVVYRGMKHPLVVHYAVYEQDLAVCLIEVQLSTPAAEG